MIASFHIYYYIILSIYIVHVSMELKLAVHVNIYKQIYI